MTEYVLISDIHGNWPAIKAVLDAEGTDREYICLGDIHGLCAYPKRVLRVVKQMDYVLSGNHDKAIFHKNEGHVVNEKLSTFELSHTLGSLSPEDVAWMRDLPSLDVIERNGQRICLAHAYPWPESASGYQKGNAGVRKGEITEVASTVTDDYDWVFLGHTHEQYDVDTSRFEGLDVHFVNPGSLGYDDCYTVVNTEDSTVQHKSVAGEYDRESVKAHVQRHLPDEAPHTDEWF